MELHRIIFNESRPYWSLTMGARACELPRDVQRRRETSGLRRSSSTQFFTGTPVLLCSYTAPESILGRPITNNASCLTARVDAHGNYLKTAAGFR